MNQNIGVTAYNRPIKIAYIIPVEESANTHWIIDAIFHESYTRWAGARTVIIPSTAEKFLHQEYEPWLQAYDADIVYSYIDLTKPLIEKISKLCCPMALIRHQIRNQSGEAERWRDYLPDFGRLVLSPVPSITTLFSRKRNGGLPTLLVENQEPKSELSDADKRMLADNFGSSASTMQSTYSIPELYEVHEPFSVISAFNELGGGKVTTFADLAVRHSAACKVAQLFDAGETIYLFVGETCEDRINFWNARNLMPEMPGVNAFLISKSWINNETFLRALCNSWAFKNAKRISLKSLSLMQQELNQIKNLFGHGTIVEKDFNKHVLPSADSFRNLGGSAFADNTSFVVTKDHNELIASEPEHFIYLPTITNGSNIRKGQWAIELAIDRQNNLSRFYRETDKWELPRRWEVARCFTGTFNSKVSRNNLLAVIPQQDSQPFLGNLLKPKLRYTLNLPDDGTVFRELICKYHLRHCPEDDLRYNQSIESYKDIKISDKGQNLRGVISMFEDLNHAYKTLTSKFWREILEKVSNRVMGAAEGKKSRMTCEQMIAPLTANAEYKELINKSQKLNSSKKAKEFIENNFKNALELLVKQKIFYQVYECRCKYCGYQNVVSIDELKKENECSICKTKFYSPVDLEWTFKLNDFVSNSVMRHSGLTTLWTIGFLHENPYIFTKNGQPLRTCFYYLPEVDLFLDDQNKQRKEIDVLCVVGGKFCAGEAKLSVSQFIIKESGEINTFKVDEFVDKINLIKPDIAILSFLTLSAEKSSDPKITKEKITEIESLIRGRIGDIELHTLIAEEKDQNFVQYGIFD